MKIYYVIKEEVKMSKETENMNEEEMQEPVEQEVQDDVVDDMEEVVEEEQVEEHKPEVVKKAKNYGHLSKEEWAKQGRDPNKWKSEEDFVEFGDSYSKLKPHIETLKKEIAKRDMALDTISGYVEEIKQKEYMRGQQEMEARLRQAKADGDMDTVEQIAKQRAQQEYQDQQKQIQSLVSQQQDALQTFMERNKHWYNEQHPDLVQKTIQVEEEIRSYYPGLSWHDLAQRVENRMKADYPDVVGTGNVQRPVITPSRSSVNQSAMQSTPDSESSLARKLSSEEREEFNQIKRWVEGSGAKYTVKEYIEKSKQLKQSKN